MGRPLHSRRRRDVDSGWAWLVMGVVFVGMMIVCSALYMGGIFFTALLHKYKKGAAMTSLLGSVAYRYTLLFQTSTMGRPFHSRCRRDVDSGWAWLVMGVVFVGMVILCSALFMGGVFFTALLKKYKKGAAMTSLLGSVSHGSLCLLGPLAGVFVSKFSCRVAIITGGALTTLGFALSAFATSLAWTIVTAGAIAGIGYCLTTAGIVCSLGFYFDKWRDQMFATAFILVGVAMFTSAPLGIYLIETHGLASTFLIVGAMQAQLCVFGVFCKPSALEQEVHARRKVERKENSADKFSQYMDVTLLKNFAFLSFLICTSAWNFALCAALMHLPNYVSVLGGSDSDINILMTIFSVSNVTGRVLGLLFVSKFNSHTLLITVCVLCISGIVTTVFPYYSNIQGGAYIFSIQLGVSVGIPNSMMTPTAVKFVGVSKLSEAHGLTYVFCGFGVTAGPFVAGYIYGRTGLYENSFLASGVVLLVGSVFGLMSLCFGRTTDTDQKLEIKVEDGTTTKPKIQDTSSDKIGRKPRE